MVALHWITNPTKPRKVFVANQVKKIAAVTSDFNIISKYCPTNMNLVDLRSRESSMVTMEKGNWFTMPDWVLDERQWPQQPELKCTKVADEEFEPTAETNFHTEERKQGEWNALLEKNAYW